MLKSATHTKCACFNFSGENHVTENDAFSGALSHYYRQQLFVIIYQVYSWILWMKWRHSFAWKMETYTNTHKDPHTREHKHPHAQWNGKSLDANQKFQCRQCVLVIGVCDAVVLILESVKELRWFASGNVLIVLEVRTAVWHVNEWWENKRKKSIAHQANTY